MNQPEDRDVSERRWLRARGAHVGPAVAAVPADAAAVVLAPAGVLSSADPLDAVSPAADVPAEVVQPPPVTPRAIMLAATTVATSLLIAICTVLPAPYAVSSPGPTRDTLGTEDGKPLIAVEGVPTYPSTGKLLLTTVSVAGGPGYPVGILGVVEGWWARSRAVAPVEQVFGRSESRDDIDARNQEAMISSQENATVAALEELGFAVPTTLEVSEAMEGSGAAGIIEGGDVILAIDGQDVVSFSDLSERMDEVEAGRSVVVGLERDGARMDLEVTTTDDGTGRALLGVLIDPVFDLPVDVTIQIENIGGPSAGTMFALGIIDTLTEADEANGVTVAGTGTMDLTGAVGPIGGIRQKLAGAVRDDATWFLAPKDNCNEVVGYIPDGLRVTAIGTLAEARAALEAIGAGEGDSLPTC